MRLSICGDSPCAGCAAGSQRHRRHDPAASHALIAARPVVGGCCSAPSLSPSVAGVTTSRAPASIDPAATSLGLGSLGHPVSPNAEAATAPTSHRFVLVMDTADPFTLRPVASILH
jgi:hypothetical protein